MKRKVLLIYTGGTIGMEKDYESGSLRAFDFGNIFEKMPEMKLMECEVFVHPFEKPLDSSDMGPEEWKIIAHYIQKNYPNNQAEMYEKLSASQPIGRMAKPIEIAHLALYLCSDEASFATGCDYPLDG